MSQLALDRTRMTPAIRSILVDHLNISCVLSSLRFMIDRIEKEHIQPEFTVLFFALSYMERFSDTIHHPKEERFLFETLARRCPQASSILDSLRAEHDEGREQLSRAHSALKTYYGDRTAWESFRIEANDYLAMQFAHMEREEQEVLPLALEHLELDDWRHLNHAFQHEDLLFGQGRTREFDSLFAFIMDGSYSQSESAD